MRTITINSYKQFIKALGEGSEGRVYNYKNKYAVKVFSRFDWESNDYLTLASLEHKRKKLEAMMKLKHPGATFPLGFANVPDDDKAYYMPIILPPCPDFPVSTLSNYSIYDSREKLVNILVKADETLQDLHKLGVYLGDIKESNIVLRDGIEPVFVDIDNAVFQDFTFDLIPNRSWCFKEIFGGDINNYADNDKLLFALMSLKQVTGYGDFCPSSNAWELKSLIKRLRVDKETREILKCIFSDAENKPYVGKVLKKIYLNNK